MVKIRDLPKSPAKEMAEHALIAAHRLAEGVNLSGPSAVVIGLCGIVHQLNERVKVLERELERKEDDG